MSDTNKEQKEVFISPAAKMNLHNTPELRSVRMKKVWAEKRKNEIVVWTPEMDQKLIELFSKYEARYVHNEGCKIIGVGEWAIRKRKKELKIKVFVERKPKCVRQFRIFSTFDLADEMADDLNYKIKYTKFKVKPYYFKPIKVTDDQYIVGKFKNTHKLIGIL